MGFYSPEVHYTPETLKPLHMSAAAAAAAAARMGWEHSSSQNDTGESSLQGQDQAGLFRCVIKVQDC